MKYVSTRGSDKEYSFTEAFLNSYANDGGIMCPKTIPRLSEETLNRWSVGYWEDDSAQQLDFFDLTLAILSIFIDESEIPTEKLETIIKMAYENFHQEELVTVRIVAASLSR